MKFNYDDYRRAGPFGIVSALRHPYIYEFENIADFQENLPNIKPTPGSALSFGAKHRMQGLALVYFSNRLRINLDSCPQYIFDSSGNADVVLDSIVSDTNCLCGLSIPRRRALINESSMSFLRSAFIYKKNFPGLVL